MPEDDIYGHKRRYESFLNSYMDLIMPPEKRSAGGRYHRKYYCKNPDNLKYFKKLFKKFDARDTSYIGRLGLLNTLKVIVHATSKDLAECERDDVDSIVAFGHKVYKTPKSKQTFIQEVKQIWRWLLPQMIEVKTNGTVKEVIDDAVMPYPVRHLKAKVDRSREKRTMDVLTIKEFEQLISAFGDDARMQAYLSLAWESLGRPQEILYTKIKDVELNDNYGKIWISEHGKEGTGYLQCIDSYPYIAKWFNEHPLKKDKNAYFFIVTGNHNRGKQLTPPAINKNLREKLKQLKIKKSVTCYSLKRSGVTFRRLRGDDDVTIQRTARWTSTRQLKVYDQSAQDDVFKKELARRGLIRDKQYEKYKQTTKKCTFCEEINGMDKKHCTKCARPLDRKKIIMREQQKDQEIEALKDKFSNMMKRVELIEKYGGSR